MDSDNVYIVQLGDTLYGIAKRFNTTVQELRELNNLDTDVISPSQVLIIAPGSSSEPSECVVYTVQKGDNLYNIAKKYNTTVDDIKKYNNLTVDSLSIGQKLVIPCYMDDEDNTTMPNYTTYVVQAGDTLYSIASKFGTTVDNIKRDNNLNSDTLTIGSTLILEDNNQVSVVEECFGEEFDIGNNYVIYTVQKGDSLYSIAKKFNTTVSDIELLNNLDSINLSIGQELKIPSEVGDTTTYTVQKGESLYSIAKKFNTTVDEIKRKNGLTSNMLSIGQKLII